MADQPSLFTEAAGAYGTTAIRYYGADATETERASGEAVHEREHKTMRRGGLGHRTLSAYVSRDGQRTTAYHASYAICGDYHLHRRESTRLLARNPPLLVKVGTMPNPAPGTNKHVDVYEITAAGREELRRLNG